MITPVRFRAFFFCLLASALFTWIGFVVLPWMELGHLPPYPGEGDSTDITPWDFSGEAHQGERVYAANGCAYCHTQQVRAATSGADLTRGWGTAKDPEDDKKLITRRTYPRDYIFQKQVMLGNSRNGADLSNIAVRFSTANELYRYLYDPYLINGRSSMPAYRFLFTRQRIDGNPSQDAVLLDPVDAAPAGYEIVPTPQGRSLVAYLLSLKKNYHLPDEKGPVVMPEKEKQ